MDNPAITIITLGFRDQTTNLDGQPPCLFEPEQTYISSQLAPQVSQSWNASVAHVLLRLVLWCPGNFLLATHSLYTYDLFFMKCYYVKIMSSCRSHLSTSYIYIWRNTLTLIITWSFNLQLDKLPKMCIFVVCWGCNNIFKGGRKDISDTQTKNHKVFNYKINSKIQFGFHKVTVWWQWFWRACGRKSI